MKKAIIITILILAMISSVLAGSLANYTVTLDDLASGSVVGKEFIFLEDGTDTFQHGIKIAPTETVTWQFGVKNYDGSFVTETDLYYELAFDVHATPGKAAIDPLIVTVKDEYNNIINTVTGTGTLYVTGMFPLSAQGQSAYYTVEIYWPSNNEIDINYAGDNFGTTVNVSAVGSQVASSSGGDQEDPPSGGDEEDPPAVSDITVVYETSEAWGEGGHWDAETQTTIYDVYRHNFEITITNNSDKKITNWELEFMLNEEIDLYSNAVGDYGSLPEGQYRFLHPQNYNKHIEPGESITFEGIAFGQGDEPITNVIVSGSDTEATEANVTCSYGTLN